MMEKIKMGRRKFSLRKPDACPEGCLRYEGRQKLSEKGVFLFYMEIGGTRRARPVSEKVKPSE